MIKALQTISRYFKTTDSDAILTADIHDQVALGNLEGRSLVNKFGENKAVGTSYVPVTSAGAYQTPTSNQALEILSDDANDTSAGVGLRSVMIYGVKLIDGQCHEQEELVELSGTTPVALSKTWFRIYRVRGVSSGRYANGSVFSQAGTITLRGAGAGATWAIMDELATNQGLGSSQIGVFTVPYNKRALLKSKKVTCETGKTVTVALFTRENCNIVTAPFGVMRLVEIDSGISAPTVYNPDAPMGLLAPNTDIGFMAKVSVGTAVVSVDFQMELFDL